MSSFRRSSVNHAPVYQLTSGNLFSTLSDREALYAHHLSRASWHGTRIILRQTSPEAVNIFDWIMELWGRSKGNLFHLCSELAIDEPEIKAFSEYAACFLSNIGNYYGSGDQKFVPAISNDTLMKLSKNHLTDNDRASVMAVPPFSLGFPSTNTQSAYYPGNYSISKDEIAKISRLMEKHSILPENTRIATQSDDSEEKIYTVLQASVQTRNLVLSESSHSDIAIQVNLQTGDHKVELTKICNELRSASKYASNDLQKQTLRKYIQSFETGDLEIYRDALRAWVRDRGPKVEHILGFVEPYRDPYGIRSEYESLVAIADPKETEVLARLVKNSDQFIRKLPWCTGYENNNGKGPFEKSLFEPPDFSSIHVIAYCSSIIFPGINLPNYNDIRQDCGFKNVIIANRMAAESSNQIPCPFILTSELDIFQKHKYPAYYIWVVLHELLGHGTGKMLCQYADGTFNFASDDPPINPLTGRPIDRWYLCGQTWTGQFEDLATTVDECRAELVGAFLMDDRDILALFNFTDVTEITAEDITYNAYMQLAVDGLRGLANFNDDTKSWGQAHSRAHFAILKCLLRDSDGSVQINFAPDTQKLTVQVDRTRIIPNAKNALAKMLLHLHMYRSTADAEACRRYYEDLSSVQGPYLEWRLAVLNVQQPRWIFVQPNTFLVDGKVRLKEYGATVAGVIESWADRLV